MTGAVTVVTDPGLSGKNLNRPGLQEVLAMIERGHVSHVLVWRLDRLSRDLGDLLLLADTFGNAEVALHSFSSGSICRRQPAGCSTASLGPSLSSTGSNSRERADGHGPGST